MHAPCSNVVLWRVPGTTAGPARKLSALPRLLKRIPTAVAVVRSAGGNHAEDTADGAENTTTPATPFRIAHRWLILE